MFKLLRYFSIASLVSIATAAVLLGFFYRETAFRQLVKSEENNNIALTKAFANKLRAEYAPLIGAAGGLSPDELRALPGVTRLHQAIQEAAQGIPVVRVKVYDSNGRTVYASEFRQIGEDKAADPGFVAAHAGGVKSSMYYRESFHAYGQTIVNRDLLGSFVPVWRPGLDTVEAVFELYRDVTPLLGDIAETQRNIVAGAVAVLALLYGILFAIVKRADGLFKRQEKERERAEELIRHLANHDALTGLPNRRLLDDRLNQALFHAQRKGTRVALMLVDLDGFKAINDTYGHRAGDTTLKVVAKRLSDCVRNADTVARQGGDEFVVILTDLAQAPDSRNIADKILHDVVQPMTIDGRRIDVGVSIGISVYPDDAGDDESMLRLADAAMYRVKQTGKGGYRYHTDAQSA